MAGVITGETVPPHPDMGPERALVRTLVWSVAHGFDPDAATTALAPAVASVRDWAKVADLLHAHRCESLAYHVLTGSEETAARLPAEFVAMLRRRYVSAFLRGSMEPALIERLLAFLADAGVPALAVKGIVVGAWLYPMANLRDHLDVDLVVSPRHAAVVEKTLAELGYDCAPQPIRYPGERISTIDYRHPSGGLHIDVSYDPLRLFWEAPMRNGSTHDPFDRWWERRQRVLLAGKEIPTLGAEDQFIHLARHLQFHDYFRANSFLDLLLLLRRYGNSLDWEMIGTEANHHNLSAGLYRTLELARTDWGIEAPAVAWSTLRPGRTARVLHRRIWSDDLAAIRDRPPKAGNPIVPRFLTPRGPHPGAGLLLHLSGPHPGRTMRYMVQRAAPPRDWLRTTYGANGDRYPALLRAHWRHLADLRRHVGDG